MSRIGVMALTAALVMAPARRLTEPGSGLAMGDAAQLASRGDPTGRPFEDGLLLASAPWDGTHLARPPGNDRVTASDGETPPDFAAPLAAAASCGLREPALWAGSRCSAWLRSRWPDDAPAATELTQLGPYMEDREMGRSLLAMGAASRSPGVTASLARGALGEDAWADPAVEAELRQVPRPGQPDEPAGVLQVLPRYAGGSLLLWFLGACTRRPERHKRVLRRLAHEASAQSAPADVERVVRPVRAAA